MKAEVGACFVGGFEQSWGENDQLLLFFRPYGGGFACGMFEEEERAEVEPAVARGGAGCRFPLTDRISG